ncbi:carbohydrate porin [Pseudomonas brassicacearum]|uniref:carbohydrate porin n=1 Tax=Pseudomonas brassicacearum TaxID=930166 RepID=UPI003857E638
MEVFGGGNAWRLSQLWYEQKFFDRKFALHLGRFGHGEDFDQFPCELQNVTLCGSQPPARKNLIGCTPATTAGGCRASSN